MAHTTRPTGMLGFTVVWVGQVISLTGSAMTLFALTIWAWQLTGSATALALMAFFAFGPNVLLSPFAGVLVDRWNRKLVMMLSDLGAGLSTVTLLVLYTTGHLQVWHLYLAGAFAGAFESFQWPAYSAAITMMTSKEQYARASGMMSFARSSSNILGPLLAGILLGPIHITGIMAIDVATFVFAIGALLAVHVPQPPASEAGQRSRGGLWAESGFGFRYIFTRPSLLALQLVFFFLNFTIALGYAVFAPMILARTGESAAALGTVQAALGVGGVTGGLLLSAWGGPKRRVNGVLLGMIFESLLGTLLMGLGRGVVIWVLAAFFFQFFIPIVNGSNQAIWQAKVPPDVQGRVFATRSMIALIAVPVGMLLAGPLADRLFEPGMLASGGLAGVFGWLVGTGRGAGMSLMFVLMGLLGMLIGLGGYVFPMVRKVEDLLPDHAVAAAQD